MRFLPRRMSIFILLVVVMIFGSSLQAQDQIVAIGSAIVQPVLRALIDASQAEASVDISVTGTNTGFEKFCAGEADITTATRPMSAQERQACGQTQTTPLELVVGQNILAFVVNPSDAEFAACLKGDELNSIYAPSSAGEITNWNQVLTEGPDLALTVLAPGDVTPEYIILDDLIEGDGIRNDATISPDADSVVSTVSATNGAIGVVTLPQAEAAGNSVSIVELDAAAVQGCQAPTAAAVEDGLYPAAEQLYIYVNTASLSKPGMTDILTFVTGDEASAVVSDAGFVPVTDVTIQSNRNNLTAAQTGELPVPAAAEFVIPTGLSGQIDIAGAGEGFDFINTSVTAFKNAAADVTVNTKMDGIPAGIRRLCNGEVDFIYSYRSLTDEEAGNCAANNITLQTIDVGTDAVVLVAHAGDDYLACLTTDQLTAAWHAQPADSALTTWDQVDPAFPDTAMTLFAPQPGSLTTDLLLLAASGSSLDGRVDIQLNDDPLYRAAATANVDGGLTFMNWQGYQNVLANNQANIQLVAVDGGQGCVTPDATTIASGDYPLIRSGQLFINRSQMIRPEVESLLWTIFSDDNVHTFEQNGYIGVRVNDLADIRSALLTAVDEVEAAAAAAAEATAEPEATAEATAEATQEAD